MRLARRAAEQRRTDDLRSMRAEVASSRAGRDVGHACASGPRRHGDLERSLGPSDDPIAHAANGVE